MLIDKQEYKLKLRRAVEDYFKGNRQPNEPTSSTQQATASEDVPMSKTAMYGGGNSKQGNLWD